MLATCSTINSTEALNAAQNAGKKIYGATSFAHHLQSEHTEYTHLAMDVQHCRILCPACYLIN